MDLRIILLIIGLNLSLYLLIKSLDKSQSDMVIKSLMAWFKPRTVFAFMFYATFCFLILKGKPIPDILDRLIFILMSAYFGYKAGKVNGEKK